MIADWDDAYANGPHIPDGDAFVARWPVAAAAFRAVLPPDRLRAGLAYGPHPRERIDLFLPEAHPVGLVVYVHGGYWRAFDRTDWSHLAAGPLGRGWAVAMPGYPLAPEVRIGAIGRSVAAAIAQAAAAVPGPLVLVGHSAGGQLVARQASGPDALAEPLQRRIRRVLAISGVHDLRPLLRTRINEDLRLDAAEAAAESPALLGPWDGLRLHAWVGGDERPEFIRQTRLLANVWTGLGADIAETVAPGRHHFNVFADLAEPASPLVDALLAEPA